MKKQKSKPKKKTKPSKKLVKLSPEQKDRRRKRKANAKRKKELEKLLKKKSKQHGPNPYSAVRFHKGFVYEQIRHTVLTASQMTNERKEMVSSALKTVTTGPEAMTLPEKPGWACTSVGFDGRVYIVSYLGTEVALFFRRQLTEIIPEPRDKIPEGVLQDPKEAWQRLDLLGRSAEKANFVLTQTQRRLEETNRILESRTKTLDDMNDSLTRRVEILTLEIKLAENKHKKELALAKREARSSQPTPKSKSSRSVAVKRGKQYKNNAAFFKAQRKLKSKHCHIRGGVHYYD